MPEPISGNAKMFGPLYAHVHPLDLEWWAWNLARAQAGELGIFRLATLAGVELLPSDVEAIEDVFGDPQVAPGDIHLNQFAPGCV